MADAMVVGGNFVAPGEDAYLLSQILPGGSITVKYSVRLNGTSNAATQFYQVRTVSDISVGSSGAIETNTGNNRDFSEYIRFNPTPN